MLYYEKELNFFQVLIGSNTLSLLLFQIFLTCLQFFFGGIPFEIDAQKTEVIMNTLMKRSNGFPAMSSFFDDFFTKDFFDWNDKNFSEIGSTLPSVNIKENEGAFWIELAVPGLRKEDFKIELDKNVLTISGEHNRSEEAGKEQRYTRREFSYKSFSRSFMLPAEVVEGDKIEARYQDGILHIAVPKKESARPQPAKTIQIQ